MNGYYRVYDGDKLVAEGKNTLTIRGKEIIAAYMAREVPSWASFFHVGVGETAALDTDANLEFYSASAIVDYSESSSSTYQVTVRGTLGAELVGNYYEIGLFNYSAAYNSADSLLLVSNFDGGQAFIEGDYTIESLYARNGGFATKMAPLSGATDSMRMSSLEQAYTLLTDNDTFRMAYACPSAFTSDVEVRFETTAADYYTYNFAPVSSPVYNVETWLKSAFTATGTPDWASIQSVSVHVTATGGAGEIHIDGMYGVKSEPIDGYGMVSRAVLGAPIAKVAGEEKEITYTLDLNF